MVGRHGWLDWKVVFTGSRTGAVQADTNKSKIGRQCLMEGDLLQVTHFNGVPQKNFAVPLNWRIFAVRLLRRPARMAELVDALDSKSCDSNIVRVRFPLWAQI